ncbi:MAG: Spy/CpxP family protein refolding chaperone [Bacteroidales bacterium]|jgi:Spy/CpxP family protein refolding chaperone|nr:Spy/CpxP family protein refolding chaperone [Bacteroidales bacterium]NCU34453.1 hypothetical protein [Candidatus Falkowbacteria bacterium]MDD2631146.1 Spy/CpxP family protein refolding chaperone [Bacteroidales bacterium]MDD3130387.1 Spy/CpxP family protein refolding chaperone [Bacteroidales bacterium]MDD3525643.1 Spy/CpxP family protein refolding chaperone [Bacteroidales bacterium]
MKKLMIIATTLLFMAGYTVNAQTSQDYNKQDQARQQGMMMQKGGMMQGGMMNNGMCPMCGQMMNQDMPMQKYMMMVNQMPNMQQQLSLTDAQADQLYDLQASFKKQQIDFQSELRKKQMKLKSLLADNASASQVKEQMKACSETRINMGIAAYETIGKMKAVLNSDQKEQLKSRMMQMQSQDGMMNQGQDGMMQNRGGMMQDRDNN